jgi:hypothetical protein
MCTIQKTCNLNSFLSVLAVNLKFNLKKHFRMLACHNLEHLKNTISIQRTDPRRELRIYIRVYICIYKYKCVLDFI